MKYTITVLARTLLFVMILPFSSFGNANFIPSATTAFSIPYRIGIKPYSPPPALFTTMLSGETVYHTDYNEWLPITTTPEGSRCRLQATLGFPLGSPSPQETCNIGVFTSSSSGEFVTSGSTNWGSSSEAIAYWALEQVVTTMFLEFGNIGVNGLPVRIDKGNFSSEYFAPGTGQLFHLIRYNSGDDADGSNDQNSIDIIGHEYAHAITTSAGWTKDLSANLSNSTRLENNGLIEGFCDIAGMYFRWKTEERVLGEPLPTADSPTAVFTLGSMVTDFPTRNVQDPRLDNIQFTITEGEDPACCNDDFPGDPDSQSCCVTETVIQPAPSQTAYCDDFSIGAGSNQSSDQYDIGGILRKFFYLLSFGGEATNECGETYEVCGVGLDLAAELIFRTVLNGYLSGMDVTYQNFRAATFLARSDISSGSVSTVNLRDAWYAVNLDDEPGQNTSVGQILPEDDEVNPGEAFTVSTYLLGSNVEDTSTICYFLSTDNAFSENDTELARTTDFTFDCNYSRTDSDQRTLVLSDVDPGNYFIIVVADCQNNLDETNENDNWSAIPITVLEKLDEKCQIDLRILDVEPSLSSPLLSLVRGKSYFKMEIAVLNQGTDLADVTEMRVYIKPSSTPFSPLPFETAGHPFTKRFLSVIAANETVNVSFNFLIPADMTPGEKRVYVAIDPTCEKNVENNVGLSHFKVVKGSSGPKPPGDGCPFPCIEKRDRIDGRRPGLLVYPNPVKHDQVLTIYFDEVVTDLDYSIVDSRGRIVQLGQTQKGGQLSEYAISTANLKPGLYFLRFRSEKWNWTNRLVIQ